MTIRNPVDWDRDIPDPKRIKRIIFYPDGLKIYGVLPYLLSRKLKGEFSSSWLRDLAEEDNFTTISYQQKPATVQQLVDWLYSDAGFEWAIAHYGEKLRNRPAASPQTFKPPGTFQKIISEAFRAAVETQEPDAPQPYDVVLGGLKPLPQPDKDSAVLGGNPS